MFENHGQLTERGGELASAGIKSAPPVAVLGAGVAGMSLEEWVFVATLVYLGLQSLYLVWKVVRELRRDRRDDAERAG